MKLDIIISKALDVEVTLWEAAEAVDMDEVCLGSSDIIVT